MGKKQEEKNTKPKAGQEAPLEEQNALEAEQAEEATVAAVAQISMDDYQKLQEELQKSKQLASESFDGWQRERADFSNYKKRMDREQQNRRQTIAGELIKKYLEVLDDIQRALKNRPAEGEGAKWAAGIELVERKFINILESEGITRIPAEKEMFDPTRHEAISSEDSPNHTSGEIIEVLQQGYTLDNRVLRPALVRVAR